jgi:DNA-binding NtrC family response regulator
MPKDTSGALVALVGSDDPFTQSLVGEAEVTGPIVSAAMRLPFDHILLIAGPDQENRAAGTRAALLERFPTASVAVAPLGLAADAAPGAIAERLALHASASGYEPGSIRFLVGQGQIELRRELMARGDVLDAEGPLYPGDGEIRVAQTEAARPGMVCEPRVQYGSRPRLAYGRGAAGGDEPEAELDRVARRLGIRGEHPSVRVALQTAAALAGHNVPVLVEGETGTGKSLIARLIHELSARPAGPYVQVNCAALPEKLVESTLFGHRKGAFTGATEDRAGKFQAADGGTLFLDEVGEMPLALQPKLLKVLEDGLVEPVGAAKGAAVDVRIVAATNRDLKAMVAQRTFREDLYYRLSFGLIRLPPLRERRSDIRHLALHALARVNQSLRQPKRLSPEAVVRLEQQAWRGNVRDLENVIGRSVLLARAEVLDADDLLIDEPVQAGDALSSLPTPSEAFSLESFLASARKQLILRALDIAGGSQSGAARLLGISPQAVHKFLKGSPADP